MYLLAINQALPYGCSFVTYGRPEGSAAGDITIIWNDVFKQSVDCAHPILSLFIFFCHHHHMKCLHFSDLRIFSLSFPLCEWFSSTPFLLLVYYVYYVNYIYGFLVHHSFCLFTMFTMLINIYISGCHVNSRSWVQTPLRPNAIFHQKGCIGSHMGL